MSEINKKKQNILIVQYRTDISEGHEQKCFKQMLGDEADITFINATKGHLSEGYGLNLGSFDRVILGGSGEFYLSRKDGFDSFVPDTMRFIDKIISKNIPMLGICFGYQLIGMYIGGKVVHDEITAEGGTYDIYKYKNPNNEDKIFLSLPDVFKGFLVHKDSLTDIPKDKVDVYFRSDKTENVFFRVKGTKIWASLIHPELTRETFLERVAMFNDYASDEDKEKITDAPEAEKILYSFANPNTETTIEKIQQKEKDISLQFSCNLNLDGV